MSLNIKSDRVHELARQAARVTGKSQTGAVEEALLELLARHAAEGMGDVRQQRLDALRTISLAWTPTEPATVSDVEDLYDPATGLPR